jgi:hypothetical protein
MSIHKLTAGSGYDYLTRQVAAFDATAKGHVALASYYAERGESPGAWIGSGMAGIDGLQADDPVTAEQMWALFGVGMHPLATQRLQQLADEQLSDENIRAATRLGAPFKLRDVEPNRFQVEVARRFADQARSTKALASQRDIRAEAARQFFQAEHGRVPTDERELSAAIAKLSRPPAQPVAGYDLTFSPVKSVSALWAVADPQIAAVIERAHQAAVGDALSFIENHVLYAREGPHGVRQVNVRGLVAAAFTHRDSRSGDPDLHTHVAVANKVQTLQGRWLSIDGRVLFKAVVAAWRPTTPPWNITCVTCWASDSRSDPTWTRASRRCGKSLVSTRSCWSGGRLDDAISKRGRLNYQCSFSVIMAGRRRRWRRYASPSRPPWKPGRRSTSPAASPSNAPPGTSRPPKRSADPKPYEP